MDYLDLFMILIMVIVFVFMFGIYAMRMKKVPPNMAMVVYGAGGYFVVTGGARFIRPMIEEYKMLSLEAQSVTCEVGDALTSRKERVRLKAVGIVSVSPDQKALMNAAIKVLDKSPKEVGELAATVISGAMRGVCSKLTYKELDADIVTFRDYVANESMSYLHELGLMIISLDVVEVKILSTPV